SEAAEDWDRLSLSVSGTGSWNAFAAAEPKPKKAAEDETTEPATDQPARDAGDGAGEPPDSPADGRSEPALTAAGQPLAAAKRNGRGRNKAKQPPSGPSALPAPTDPADEWISLLTADSAEELSVLGANRPRSDQDSGPRLSRPGSRPGLPGPVV